MHSRDQHNASMDLQPMGLSLDQPLQYKSNHDSQHKPLHESTALLYAKLFPPNERAGCPGVLVVKRAVLPAQNSLPTEPGGGTVFYVTEEHHRYKKVRKGAFYRTRNCLEA